MSDRVLLIEDDDAMRASLTQTLELEDITVLQANGLAQARRSIRANFVGIVLSDIRMPQSDGFEVLARVQEVDPDLPVVFLTGEADVPMAVRALRDGAYDFLEKPCATEDLLKSLRRAMRHRQLVLQTRSLERRLESSDVAAVHFPGSTPASVRLRGDLRRVADLSVNLHLHGEPGAGKRLSAHTVQVISGLSPSYAINCEDADCAAQLEVILGVREGFLTLKNVEAISDEALQIWQEMVHDLGDLRVVSTARVELARLRRDVVETLSPFGPVEIYVPSLMQRAGDLPIIFEALLRQAARDMNTDMPAASQATLDAIQNADWSRNLPAMRAFARQCVVGTEASSGSAEAPGLVEQIEAFERQLLIEALRRNDGKASKTATELKLARKTLYDRMSRYEIKPKDLRPSKAD